jgi:hypothetical protein
MRPTEAPTARNVSEIGSNTILRLLIENVDQGLELARTMDMGSYRSYKLVAIDQLLSRDPTGPKLDDA